MCNGVTARGPWTSEDASKHINELELLAALFALESYLGHASGLSVRLLLDSSTAVCYVNKSGGTRSLALTDTAKRLASFCESRSLSVEAVHLAGKLNVVADRESRAWLDASDWMLNVEVFGDVNKIWPSKVDLFAAFWNAQLPSFFSWGPQPGAAGVDAFARNWVGLEGYAFPPFSLIFRCLDKIAREEAKVVFICPVWSTQPWFPVLLELTCDVPLLLQPSSSLLVSPLGQPHPLLASGSLRLAAWRLSGSRSDCRAFRSHWSHFSWPVIEPPPMRLTVRHGQIGQIGVFEGVKIPCRLL